MRLGRVQKTIAAAMIIVAWIAPFACAQFVPGNIYLVLSTNDFCESDKYGIPYDIETVLELNPITGETRVFAEMPREYCSGLSGMAMSPDGKRLRIASRLWGVIFEFDAFGAWEVVLDLSDGVFAAGGSNSIAFDRDGNFYISNETNVKVLRFPADGGPPSELAYLNNNGIILNNPHAIAVTENGRFM